MGGGGTPHRLTSCYSDPPPQNVMATAGMTCLCGDYMGWPADLLMGGIPAGTQGLQ